jgi:hypothetical protein
LAIGVLVVALCAQALAAERVALVIGNGAYAFTTPLPNPTNDATDMGEKLKALGFEVHGGLDLDREGMRAAIDSFADRTAGAKVVLFFYAGHAMEINGKNYLLPVDAKLETASAIDAELIDVDAVVAGMQAEGGSAILLLDACRDNPLSRRLRRSLSRSGTASAGLAAPAATGGNGLMVVFATSPGAVAADGDGRNSPFTKALLANLGSPGTEIQQVMTQVKREVWVETRQDQQPWVNSSLAAEVYLVPAAVTTPDAGRAIGEPPEAIEPLDRRPADEMFWAKIGTSTNPRIYELFIKNFPDSKHVADAKARLAELMPATATDELFWRKIETSTDPDVYEAFLKSFPNSKHADDARARIVMLRAAP